MGQTAHPPVSHPRCANTHNSNSMGQNDLWMAFAPIFTTCIGHFQYHARQLNADVAFE